MKKRNLLTLGDEFLEYCRLNNIEDIEKLGKDTFQRGFTILKYGEIPSGTKGKETVKEITIEKIVEVPVEKIVEVIKEVTVEKIVEVVKEVPVETKGEVQIITKEVIKEVPIVDEQATKKIEELIEENKKLKNDLELITKSLEKFNKGAYLKRSDLSNLYEE
jgi:hypothetical protein